MLPHRGASPMPERRAWRLDLAALILFALGAVATVALVSHDPADLPGSVYPPPSETRNLLGQPGAQLAGALLSALGLAAGVWLAAWFVQVVVLLRRRDWLLWSFRLGGWLLLVPLTAVLAQRWPDELLTP